MQNRLLPFSKLWLEYHQTSFKRDNSAEMTWWEKHAATYDRTNSLAKDAPQVVKRLVELLNSSKSVTALEIGAGTGEFTLPVVRAHLQVTALDQSPAMLAVLQDKLENAGFTNFTTQNCLWEDYKLSPNSFDYVVAVNSLYRLAKPLEALQKIHTTARQKVIIIRSIGGQPCPPPLFRESFGESRLRPDIPDHLYLIGTLYELGINANLEIFPVERVRFYPTWTALEQTAHSWFVSNPTEQEQVTVRKLLGTMGEETKEGVIYRHAHDVAVIHWDKRS